MKTNKWNVEAAERIFNDSEPATKMPIRQTPSFVEWVIVALRARS